MSTGGSAVKWSVGDRVTFPLFLDDGTWAREGDSCLERSPLRHGVVTRVEEVPAQFPYASTFYYHVLWDDSSGQPWPRYFAHALTREQV